jgi:hypothetical protein
MDKEMDNHTENVVNQMDKEPKFNEKYYLNLVAAKDTTIQVLTDQLQSKDNQLHIKDSQLQVKDTQLSSLIERTREQNIIIQSLQDKVNLQLQAPQSNQINKQVKTPLADKLLIGVALVVSLALLLFVVMMGIAYLNK